MVAANVRWLAGYRHPRFGATGVLRGAVLAAMTGARPQAGVPQHRPAVPPAPPPPHRGGRSSPPPGRRRREAGPPAGRQPAPGRQLRPGRGRSAPPVGRGGHRQEQHRAARGRAEPDGLAEDGADVRVQVEAGRVGHRQPHHRRLTGVVLLDRRDSRRQVGGQVGGEDQVPAPERLRLARPLSLLLTSPRRNSPALGRNSPPQVSCLPMGEGGSGPAPPGTAPLPLGGSQPPRALTAWSTIEIGMYPVERAERQQAPTLPAGAPTVALTGSAWIWERTVQATAETPKGA